MVRRAAVGYGGRVQGLRRELPRRGAPGAGHRGGRGAGRPRAGRSVMPEVFGMVLAGGEGKRLAPLTAVVNAGLRRIVVLTQYKSHSLDRHVSTTWSLSPLLGNYVTPVPAQMRRGPRWFAGSADAIYQNFNLLYDERPAYVCVFGADHIYRMDARQMIDQHVTGGAAVTVAALRVPVEQADQFGIIETDINGRTIAAFREKPTDAVGLPDAPEQVYASMGNYVFTTEALIDAVTEDAADETSKHDMGGSIVPMLVERGQAQVYDFSKNEVPGASEVRLRRRRPPRAGARLDGLRGRGDLGGDGAPLGAVARCAPALQRARRGLGDHAGHRR